MNSKRIVLCSLLALVGASAFTMFSGCGGGGSNGSSPLVEAVSDFSYGPFIGRAAISNPPITTNSVDTTITGLKGTITALDLNDTALTLEETRIVFNSDRDGNREIYVMNVDGSNQTRLTNNSAHDFEPACSPD